MRITNFHKFNMSHNQMTNILSQQNKIFEQAMTGKKVNRASDDPIRYNEYALIQKTESKLNQYESNLNDSKNLLERIDVVLNSSVESIHIAKTSIVQASNDSLSDKDKGIISDTINETIDQLMSFANTKHLDRYLFSGQKVDVKPMVIEGNQVKYNGNDENMTINISESIDVEVTQSGEKIFSEMINSLIEARDSIKSGNNDDIQEAASRVDDAFINFVDERSRIGVQLTSVDVMENAYKETKVDLESKKQNSIGVDMSQVLSEFQQLGFMYEATMKSTITLNNTSILNFL